jgi:hypothetical protein
MGLSERQSTPDVATFADDFTSPPDKSSYLSGTPLTSRSGFVFHLGVQPGFSTLVRKMTVLSRAMSSV